MNELKYKKIDEIKGKEKESLEYNNKNEENDTKDMIKKSTKVSVKDSTIIDNEGKTKNKEKTELLFYPAIKENNNNLFCKHCNQDLKIEMRDIYKLNCINIQCIYEHCLKFSFISLCPKCQAVQIISKVVFEGDLIKCSNQDCGFLYFQISCPFKYCQEMFYFTNPKTSNNFPNGIIHAHQKKSIFQKINCIHCFKPIVYFLEKSETKSYYEAMKVICPYDECGKTFNRIICASCNEVIYMVLGLYMMGKKIKCPHCNYIFSKVICPFCLKVNPYIKNNFQYGELSCRHSLCSKKSSLVNCCHCQRINYFLNEKRPLIPGIKIKCGYCSQFFCEVVCPGCTEINYFPKGNFAFGRVYKCQYTHICSKSFMILICPECNNYSRLNEDSEGKKYTCNICNTLLANFQCPFCFVSILDKDSSFLFGQIIECPACKKHFSFFRCYECKRLIYSKENECILGKSVFCNFCKNFSVNILCTICKSKITFSKRTEDFPLGEKADCPNCKEEFVFGNKIDDNFEQLYNKNLSCAKQEDGIPIKYGESSKDENYEEKIKIYDNNNEHKKKKEKNKVLDLEKFSDKKSCIICQSNIKESVFFPCGHRCCCYICSVYYYEVFKRCPRCNNNATGIIPKIFDVY